MNKPITPEQMHEWVEKTWQKCQDEARGDVKGQAMSTQPEALRLADHLECNDASQETQNQSAAELRRLHAANQELLEALKAHGSHTGNCDYLILLTSLPPQRKPCSCGLHAVIAKHGEKK